jgi:NhaP-type Na+/H+ or K+/H+ antiporter
VGAVEYDDPIVSPTDAIAATSVAQRLGVPRRIVTILEGESLVNDATGIVAYRIAVAAVVLGTFSLWQAGLQFVIGAVGGVAVGLAMGWVVIWVRRHVADDPNVQNTISLLTPFATYLLAEEPSHWAWEQLGFPGEFAFSGVLAVVTAGLYLGRRAPYVITPETRLQGYAFWELVTFLLNGVILALIGLQLGGIVERLSESTPYSVVTLVFYGALISLAVILARFMWIFLTTYVRRWLSRRVRQREPTPPVRQSTAGERGHRARSQKPERFIEDFRVRVLSGERRVRGDNPGGAEGQDGSGGRLRPHGGALAAALREQPPAGCDQPPVRVRR